MTHDRQILELISIDDLYRLLHYESERYEKAEEALADQRRTGNTQIAEWYAARLLECDHQLREIKSAIEKKEAESKLHN